MCTVQLPPKTIIATSGNTSEQFIPMTDWIPAISVKELKTLLHVLEITSSNMEILVAYQTADTTTGSPNTYVTFSQSAITSTGRTLDGLTDISANTDDVMYIRFGIVVKNSVGTSLQRAQLSLIVNARA